MNKKVIIFAIIVLFCICGIVLYKSTKIPTYIEFIKLGQKESDVVIQMKNPDDVLEQKFTIPYKMFYGVGLLIGTYDRDNNSIYEINIIDNQSKKTIITKEFNASHVENSKIHKILLDSPIEVDNTHEFSIIITPKTVVHENNSIAFFADKNSSSEQNLFFNHLPKEDNPTLSMNVYGGNPNTFWTIFVVFAEIYVVSLILYGLYLYLKKKPIMKNDFIQAGILGIVIFILLSALVNCEFFIDEYDNIMGGMLIEKGKLLYVDYCTQHTSFSYWLCAMFALFQAGSLIQFRVLYYALISLIYVALFLRHKKYFGTKKMLILPLMQVLVGILFTKEFVMIISDNIQAVCMVALLLEFLQYLKDEKLDWKRSIIVALSIFGSVSTIFISLYAIVVIVIGVFIKEIICWKNKKSIRFVNIIRKILEITNFLCNSFFDYACIFDCYKFFQRFL